LSIHTSISALLQPLQDSGGAWLAGQPL